MSEWDSLEPWPEPVTTAELVEDIIARFNNHVRIRTHDGMLIVAFAKNGITYQSCPLSASELYLHSLPAWTSGTVAMLDNPRAIDELTSLRRKVGQAGKEHVIHMRGHHDDLANTIAGVIYRLTPMQPVVCSWGGIGVVSRLRDYHGLYPGEADDNMAAWLRSQGQVINRTSLSSP
jgi:hypothetical protein